MIGLRVVIAVAPLRLAGGVQIGRVGVNQFVARKRELGQQAVAAPVHQFHLVLAAERADRAGVAINADVPQRRRLALHDRAATEMGLDLGGMRRHGRDQRLAQTRGRLRSVPSSPRRVLCRRLP